jgi:acetylornithine/LysW-gamma-L-lysine aminotransferase
MNIIAQEQQFTSGVYGKRDMAIVSGSGAQIWDADGNSYIDCTAGIGVASIGHSHPLLVEAITAQAQALITCQEMFYNDRRAELLTELARLMPGPINRFFLCNSGTEAVEGAIKFARLSTGRTNIIATTRGFHGRTLGSLSATHKSKYRTPFLPLVPGFTHVPFGQIAALENEITHDTAAVVLEIVQGEGGVRPGTSEFFQAAEAICREQGALLIIDEIQTGFGRTGRWFAFEHMDIAPDLVCMGKAIAGGLPMGAVGIGPRVSPLPVGAHGSTFGGNPLACAASLAALRIIKREDLVSRAAEMGHYCKQQLERIDSPLIREVRGLGLMIGLDLKVRVIPLVKSLAQRGVQVLTAGPTVIRLLPPLVITREELDIVVSQIAAELRSIEPT